MDKEEEMYKCFVCKEVLFRSLSHLKRNEKNFCSRECYAFYRNPNGAKLTMGNTGVTIRNYGKIHRWLNSNFGKASKCEHCHGKQSKRYEWALIKGKTYQCNRDNFIELCPSCHRKYDDTPERRAKLSESLKGIPSSRIRAVSLSKDGNVRFFKSITEAAKVTGVGKTSIHNVLAGLSKKAGGYICHYQ